MISLNRLPSWPPVSCVTCCTAPPAASTISTLVTISRSRSASEEDGSVRNAKPARTVDKAATRIGKSGVTGVLLSQPFKYHQNGMKCYWTLKLYSYRAFF